jgi:hypothetical protein
LTFVLALFGFCNVVACFILFSLAQGDDVGPTATFGVDHHDDHAPDAPEGHQALLIVAFANVFACDREAVPNLFTAYEIESTYPDVPEALPFVSCNHS